MSSSAEAADAVDSMQDGEPASSSKVARWRRSVLREEMEDAKIHSAWCAEQLGALCRARNPSARELGEAARRAEVSAGRLAGFALLLARATPAFVVLTSLAGK